MSLTTDEIVLRQLQYVLAATVSIVLGLVGVIYHIHTKRQDEQQAQLDDGQDEFASRAIEIAQMKKDLEALQLKATELEKKIEATELKYQTQHDIITIIKVKHEKNHGERIE